MGRPIKETVEYFPHFVKGGRTIFILESKFGNDGYAFWFKLLEILCDTNNHFFDCKNASNWEFLLAKTHTTEEIANKIIKTLIDLGKIDEELWEDKVIWIQSLANNLAFFYERRSAEIPKKPQLLHTENYNNNSLCEQKLQQKEIYVNKKYTIEKNIIEENIIENKKENIEKEKKKFKIPTIEEVRQYCEERKNGIDAETFWNFYQSKGWKVGKEPMKDWKAAVRTWEHKRKQENNTNTQQTANGIKLGVGEYIEEQTGRRTYGTGKATIPLTAPPRPTDKYCWNAESQTWIML